MSRDVVGQARLRDGSTAPISIHRSGTACAVEVGGVPRFRFIARNAAFARDIVERMSWWLSWREFASFDELHDHVVAEYDRARACAARMQRGSVRRTGPLGSIG